MSIPWKQMVKTAWMSALLLVFSACDQTLTTDSTGGTTSGYTLHFDSKGGTLVESIVFDGKSVIDIPNFPEKDENVFDGWFVDDGSFQIDFTEDYFVSHPLTCDTTVYAKWIPHKYTINFILDGVTVDSLRIAYGSDLSLIEYPEVPEKKGFLFSGWNLAIPDTMPNHGLDIAGSYGWQIEHKIDDGFAYITNLSGAGLTELILPDTIENVPVKAIGKTTFGLVESLERIVIPKNYTEISKGAFDGLENLKEIIVDADNPNFSSDQGVLFDKERTLLLKYPEGKTESTYDIPDGVSNIRKSAFIGSSHLESLTIPDSVAVIDEEAFSGATGLKSVVIADGVRTIGPLAFYGAINLAEIVIPDSVSFIGMGAFANTNLTHITLPAGMTFLGPEVFAGVEGLTEIVIPSTINCILDYAFTGIPDLTEIWIPSSVLHIAVDAFEGTSGLTSINVDSANPNYSSLQGILFDKDQTTLVKYPEGKTETEYHIPDGVTKIAWNAFQGDNPSGKHYDSR